MNKQDLVEALSARMQKSQKEASETIDALVDEIKKALGKGEAIRISGFGAFEQTVRSARQGRNPRTGEPVRIAPTRGVRFRPAADFKAIVAGTRKAVAAAVPGGASVEAESAVPKKTAATKTAAKKTAATKTAAKKTAAKKTAAKKTSAATRTTVNAGNAGVTSAGTAAKRTAAAKKSPAKQAVAAETAAAQQ